MTTPTPPITLHTASTADFHEIALLELEVFSDDFCNLAYGPHRASTQNILFREKILGSQPQEKGGRNVVTKAVVVNEGKEEIVGAAGWSFYTGREGGDVVEGGEGKGNVVQEELKKEGGWGEGANVKLCEDAFVWADEQVAKITEGKNYACEFDVLRADDGLISSALNTIVVSPRHQRSGIGKMLMEDGLKEVDCLGLQVAHGASQQGLGLYKKYEYVELETKDINLSEYEGGEGMGSDKHSIVYRPAHKQV